MALPAETHKLSSVAFIFKRGLVNLCQTTNHLWQNLYDAALICLCGVMGRPIDLSWAVGASLVALGRAVFLGHIYYRQVLLRFVRFPYELSSALLAIGLSMICREPIFFSIILLMSVLLFYVQSRAFETRKLRVDPDYVRYAYLVSMFFPQAWPAGRLSQDYAIKRMQPLRRCLVFAIALALLYARTRSVERWDLRVAIVSLSLAYFLWCFVRLLMNRE